MPDTITQKRNSTNAKATLESDNTVTTSIDRPNVTAKVLEAYFAYRNEKKILPDAKKNEIETKYEYALKKVNKGIVSKTLYIVVKTESIIDRNIKISICSAKDKVLTDINIPVKLLYGIDELEEKELLINNYNNDVSIKNKDDFKNQTIFEVTLQPENDDDKKKWIETLSNSTNKKAFLYIKTEVIEENEVIYKGKGKDNKCFLFDNPFELSDICFCDKEMSVQEVKDMVTLLNSGKVKNNLFADRNSKIKIEDRTYEKLTEELNAVFNKYEINTCNRKAHFIAQLYLESARFGTATEYAEGQNYDSKSWENQKDELQLQLTNINTLKSEIDDIMTNLEKTAIEENKPQIKEIELRITSTDTLTEIQEETINTYKSIFEKQWKQNLDNTKTIKYETKKQYEDAVTRAESKISTIKANKNTEEGDGPRYKGKGLIQVTWRDAYEKYFNYIKSV
jgi:predicted chitinase